MTRFRLCRRSRTSTPTKISWVDLIMNNNILNINPADLKKLFSFTISRTHFLFNGNFYGQVAGVAMGSPLAPVLAYLFMSHQEQDWLPQYWHNSPEYYRRYVYETFCLFKNEQEENNFFEYLNTRHPCITFTMEMEGQGNLPFLDVLIAEQTGSSCKTSFHHKTTYTGLLTTFSVSLYSRT